MDSYTYTDLTLLPIPKPATEFCEILYQPEYTNLMSIFRALLLKREYSPRALAVTERVIGMVAAHYTVWQYRYQIVMGTARPLLDELDWCEEIALDNPKNYQIWPYRQLLIEALLRAEESEAKTHFNYARELPLMGAMLEEDEKNYHVWSYRKWFVQRFGLLESEAELAFTDKMIREDVWNNSAWNHRFYVSFGAGIKEAVVEREVAYAQARIEEAPGNPAAWNYLEGVGERGGRAASAFTLFATRFTQPEGEISVHALEMVARAAESLDADEAMRIYVLLGTKYDKVRARYWDMRRGAVQRSQDQESAP